MAPHHGAVHQPLCMHIPLKSSTWLLAPASNSLAPSLRISRCGGLAWRRAICARPGQDRQTAAAPATWGACALCALVGPPAPRRPSPPRRRCADTS
eukprot:scaffold10073_cov136-Isochrysis_galbana.AAC.9